MKVNKILFLLFFFNIIILYFTYTQDESDDHQNKFFKITSDHIVDITINAGVGIYTGDFYKHLINDGAYIVTPIIDIDLSLFIIKYFGLKTSIGSGSVIHPYSQPIEGTIIYMGFGVFFQYEWEYAFINFFTNAGFQHTTMLLQWYASGYFECGTGFGIKITKWMYITSAIKYRMGFLNSIIIHEKYDIDYNDTISSINFSTGLVFRIKNYYKKK